VSLIAGAIAALPLKFYRVTSSGEREVYKPDEWWLLNEQAFPCWSAATAWEYATASLLLLGDSFWRIHRQSPNGRITGFEPLHPGTVEVFRVDDRLVYRVAPQPSQRLQGNVQPVVIDQDDMLHIAGPGFDGLRGQSLISSALRVSGRIALGADQHAAAFFENGQRPDFALETDAPLSEDQVQSLRNQLSDRHGGPTNAWRPIVLQGGLKVHPLTMSAHDAQLLEQRRFQVEDIARIFGVPPFMIGHTEKTTSWGSGVEQMSIGFIKYTLQRHLVKFEQEINRKIFRRADRFCEFDTTGLERGDIKTRFEAYRIALGRAGERAWMRPSEVRRRENLPPDEALDAEPQPQPAPTQEASQ
jgi:HK97 family phage portal protein